MWDRGDDLFERHGSLPAIAAICREHNLWFHVDAAMSGTAALCPEFRHIQQGVELADSYCFNPHKWMFTNFDCDCFYVADRKALINTLSILPEYLKNQATESGAVIRLSRLANSVGPPISFTETMVRHPSLWRGRACNFTCVSMSRWLRQFAGWVQERRSFRGWWLPFR